MEHIIELNNINKIYGQEVKTQVLHDVTLTIKEGSFNSIIGQSGSGKTTLLNVMGSLDKATSGDVFINGLNTNNMTQNQLADLRNQTIGFVFQFHYLLPEFTAIENVLLPYEMMDKKISKDIIARAEELLELVGLEKVMNNPANKMSGGQQQRTAIARALMNQPKIILADEPTGNLDSDSTEAIYELLKSVNERYGTTFVVITHDKRIAEKADRIIEIKDGRIYSDISKIV
jgi:lipoprotein-releasing system ATP-binding protein